MTSQKNNIGYTPKELLLQKYKDEEEKFKEITRLDDNEKIEYSKLLQELTTIHSNPKSYNTTQKGKALEDVVSFLLQSSAVFDVYENVFTTTNEIDQLLCLSYIGKNFESILPFSGREILSECKNYHKKVGVTWVGKLYTLLENHSTKIGLLFSYHGLSGSNWNDATGLVKKINLLREKESERTYILDFNIKDFNLIANGSNLIELIDLKIKSIRHDTNIQTYFEKKHPAIKSI